MCDGPLERSIPGSCRMERGPDGYRWTDGGEVMAAAALRDGRWEVRDPETGRVVVTIVPAGADRPKLAVVDHKSRLIATFTPASPAGRAVGVLEDGHGRLLMAVRGDGPTGVHVIDASGDVLALASPATDGDGFDLLLTEAGSFRATTLLFGVALAVDVAAHRVSST
jgi:hypothetical protein